MQTTYHRPAPSFPPADDLLAFLAAIPWRKVGGTIITTALAATALAYCLGQRARRAIGPRAAEALRTMADTIDVPPAPTTAEALEALPVRELRILARQAGHRALARSGRRADLLEILSA
jgi:hypothetical protein